MDYYMHTLTHMPALGIPGPKTPPDTVPELFTGTTSTPSFYYLETLTYRPVILGLVGSTDFTSEYCSVYFGFDIRCQKHRKMLTLLDLSSTPCAS